jgi:hypothetical protein
MQKPQGEVTETDLREMAEGASTDGRMLRTILIGEFTGFQCESLGETKYSVRWFVACGPVALHISYNCSAQERGRERDVVNCILATLKCVIS